MADYAVFKHGGVQYPLTASTSNSLLLDADPAVYYALRYIAGVLDLYLGDRLLAQAALEGLDLPGAVATQLFVEPSPALAADKFSFPLLALYRKSEKHEIRSSAWERDVCEWELAYVLPPLPSDYMADQLTPILRAVVRVISHAVRQGWDPNYNSGQKVWTVAGIESIGLVSATYGGYSLIEDIGKFYRAVVCKLQVTEKDYKPTAHFESFTGGNVNLDLENVDETVVTDFVQTKTYDAPTVTSLTPATGTTLGGTSVTITGTGFLTGATVTIGAVACTSVVVVSGTSITCVTGAHAAYTTFAADVTVTNLDDQAGTLEDGFSYVAP